MFEDVTTGAGNDLQRATDIARAMVSEYGMGETLGLSTYPRQRGPVFLSNEQQATGGREYSEKTAARLDEEVKSILAERERHVLEMPSTGARTPWWAGCRGAPGQGSPRRKGI